jgi:putative membrane protein
MVISALRPLGVVPIAAICAYRMITLALNTRSWAVLLPPEGRPRFPTLMRMRWIGESVNTLLPVAQVGGDFARAALVTSRGVPRADAAASMMADLATGVLTHMIFGLGGAAALFHILPKGRGHGVWTEVVAGLLVATLVVVGVSMSFHLGAAHIGRRLLGHSRAQEKLGKLAGSILKLDQAISALLARETAVVQAVAWHLLGWISQVGETWMLLHFFDAPVTFRIALAIESLSTAARGAAFFVPSGIGVQEVTIFSICRLLGIDMEDALALTIAKRAREILMGVPGLLAWLMDQGWWKRWRGGHE